MIFAIKKAKNVTFIQKDLSHLKYLVKTFLLLRLKKMSVSQNLFHYNGYFKETMVTSSRAD